MMRRNKKTFTVLSLDPSLTAFGWVVLRGMKVLDKGCIKTTPCEKKLRIRKGDDKVRRLNFINLIFKDLIKKYEVNYILSELPHGSQSASAAIALGMVTGLVQAMADFNGLGIEWYSEGDAKLSAIGNRSGSKEKIIEKMKTIYSVNWDKSKYVKEAVADSLAIHYVACKQSPIIKTML